MILHLFLDDKYIYNRRNFMQEFLTYIKQEIKTKIIKLPLCKINVCINKKAVSINAFTTDALFL